MPAAARPRSQRRAQWAALLAILCAVAAGPALAGPTLERIRAGNVLRCGAEQRPGVAEADENGVRGLAVDLCRASAIAVLGPAGRIDFRVLDGAPDFEAARQGTFDLLFVSGDLVAEGRLAADIVLGPPVFIDRLALMVPENAAARRPADLAARTICFMTASPAQRALESAFEGFGLGFSRAGFEEDVEMRDAYNVGRCQAIAGLATTLAEIRQDGGIDHLKSRILEEPLALDPVFAATSVQDGRWAATVAWLMHGLVAASAPPSAWHGSATGLDADSARALGLRDHWQAEVSAILGGYADMLRRSTGSASELHLDAGPDAAWPAGLLLTPQAK